MVKQIFLLFLLLVSQQVKAQTTTDSHKIVFQLITADTTAHKAFMKQLNNIHKVSPNSDIQVVVHGPAIQAFEQSKSVISIQVENAIKRGVVFSICEFSLQERKVAKDQLLANLFFVKAGIIHIVELQEKNYCYIKAGF
jgi:intracellular sulfur oxidation DsrE/DsrF family protein